MTKIQRALKAAFLPVAVAIVLLLTSTLTFAEGGHRYQSEDAWTFGVTADTQWVITHGLEWDDDDPYYAHVNPNYAEENPDYVSVSTLLELNKAFIDHDVRFVIQLGDLTDRAGNAAMYTHAAARQPLYDAGIGFFPVRGNHEVYGDLYGLDPDKDMNIPAWRDAFPQTQGLGVNLFGTANFTRPAIEALRGLSYSFDYGPSGSNARFVFVDTEATGYEHQAVPNHPVYGDGAYWIFWTLFKHDKELVAREGNIIPPGTWFRITGGKPSTNFYGYEETWPIDEYLYYEKWETAGSYFPGAQQAWITDRLSLENEDRPAHAIVLTHRMIMGQNHDNSMFGSSADSSPNDQNVLLQTMQDNNVRYLLAAHDHMHNRSIVASPDYSSFIEQLISSSSDPKFYQPKRIDSFNGDKGRETIISQELYNIGYYIYTVDGPRLTVDYYADANGNFGDMYCWPDGYAGDGTCNDPRYSAPAERIGSFYVPDFDFIKTETWGYGLNGQQVIIQQGESYDIVGDSFNNTFAAILNGVNNSTSVDNTPYAQDEVQAVDPETGEPIYEEIIDDETGEITQGDPIMVPAFDDEGNPIWLSQPRPLSKHVTTGWVEKPAGNKILRSDIFSLWGISERRQPKADEYVLQMSYVDPYAGDHDPIGIPNFRLATVDGDGNWVPAIDMNIDSEVTMFVEGPYVEGYPLGTHGMDAETGTVWAVLNYEADFAAVNMELHWTASGFVYNRRTGVFQGKITLTNNTEDAIGSFNLVLGDLTPGVTITNAHGGYNGSPYMSIPGGLAAGESIVIQIQFTNSGKTPLNFNPVTYRSIDLPT